MNRIVPIFAALALVAPMALASSATEESNLRYLLGGLGLDAVPEGTATVLVAGVATEMTIAEALALTVQRVGNVDVGAIAHSSIEPAASIVCVGDCWVIEIGVGACPAATILAPSPVPFTAFHPQFWTYPGALGMATTPGPSIVLAWTLKLTSGVAPNGVTMIGHSDFYCVSFFGLYIWFPFVNGVVLAN